MANQKIFDIKINGIKEGIDGASTLRSKLDNASQGVTDYSKAMREATKEVRTLQGQMVGLDKGSQQWKELAKQAGEYQDKVNDIREATRRYASDTKALDDVINLAQSTTSAFGILQGVMSEFGVESEEAAEAIKKLQATMTILTSLQQLQNSLKGSSATATLLTKAMNLLGIGMNGVSTASKALRLALASIGIGLVITAVTLLVEHWEDLCNWFDKSFPLFKKCGGFMNTLEAAAKGLGKAVLNWIVNPYKTVASVFKHLFAGDFEGAMKAATDGIKQQFKGTVDAFKNTYQKQVDKGLEEITLKQTEEENKRTKHNLDMLKAQKGNAAKFSKEGIALQKKDFAERRKLAKGNQDELNKIAVDEANFYRECQESKSAAAQKAARNSVKAYKDAARERAEAEKKAEEEAKKAAEFKAKADEAYYRSYVEYLIKQKEEEIEYYEAGVKMYSAGPPEKYQAELKKVNTATEELVTLQRQLHLYDFFNDYKDNIDASATSLNDFMANMNVLVEQFKLFGDKVSVEEFGVVAKQLKMFSKLTDDQLKYLYHIYIDYLKDGLTKAKKTEEDTLSVQEEQLKKEMEAIEKNTLKYELESDKKSETAQALVETLNAQWDNYLEHAKAVYKEDSLKYLEAQKKKKQQNPKDQEKKSSGGNQFMDFEDNGGVNWGDIKKKVEDAYDAYVGPVVNGLSDTIGMMMDIAIEEAEEALEEIEEMYDSAQEKTDKSRERLSELETAMSTANGGRLEQLKQEQAEEIQLMLEREAEEKRLEKEKEKREKELEKKKKQQRKLELRVQMVEAFASGALAAINGFATKPFIPVGLAMGALATTLTAVQLGIMAKQMSKLASGGVLGGKEHKDGGVKIPSMGIELEKGEAVINKRSTAKYLPLLDAINAEGNGGKHTLLSTSGNVIKKYANGGVLNAQRIDDNFNQLNQGVQLRSALESINFTPVVEVVEVAKGLNNLSAVRESAGGSSLLK
jgi:hypothetical protein